ncbi:MAG: hypothetical protein Q7T53_04445 [Deltaproteobacteria bacterium]|nr:hypothetical protein [Deltaproteobacteria bacterium]
MKIIEYIEKYAPIGISIPLTLHITTLAGIWFLPHLEKLLPPDFCQLCDKVPIFTIILMLLSSYLIMLASYSLLYFKFKNKLLPKFGVLWDKNKEAYCPSCQILLSDSHSDGDYHHYSCVKCGKTIYLTHLGNYISLSEAIRIFQNKKP